MRIVHVTASVSRRAGGPATLLRGLVPVQVDRGHEVIVVTTDMGAEFPDDLEIRGADMRVAPTAGPHWLGYGRGMRRAVREAIVGADAVNVHGVYLFSSLWGMREARAAGVKYLVAPHGVWTDEHKPAHPWLSKVWDTLLLRRDLPHADVVISDSRRDAEGLRARGLTPVEEMVLGVDPKLALIETPWAERSGVLFLSRVARKKRVDLAIEAYARSGLAERGHRLTVAGPIEATLPYDPRELAAAAGVGDSVDFIGMVDAAQRRELLGEQRVFILPSDDESFGMAAAEAATAGMAVVASDKVAAMLEAEEDGAGRAWPQDPDALAGALRDACADDAQASAILLRDYARENWTWAHASLQFEEMVGGARAVTG
ncbi:glycosyltransferase [Demequina soli]|uniref:glycosyltransferase n=1 Tax=Demequina soli TaxID=1638987 RepID=UPI000781FFD0|nr:glycosyltransferase [Demequina soli]